MKFLDMEYYNRAFAVCFFLFVFHGVSYFRFVCKAASGITYAQHETTVVDTESKSIPRTDFQISIDELDTSVGDIDPEILALTTFSDKSLTPTPDQNNVSSPKLVLSDSNIQSTISAFLALQQKDDTASISSVPELLQSHTSQTAPSLRLMTSLSRPVTSSTRPVTSADNRIKDVLPNAVGQRCMDCGVDAVTNNLLWGGFFVMKILINLFKSSNAMFLNFFQVTNS